MPLFYSTAECDERSLQVPDFGPGDFVESCWRGFDSLLQVREIFVDHGRYAFSSTGLTEHYAGFFRKASPPQTNHRIGVPKNKLP